MLELFHLTKCPYSKKVRDYIEKNDLRSQIEYREISEDHEARQTLKSLTGREQVPCLVINGQPLLESKDIIAWLESNSSSLRAQVASKAGVNPGDTVTPL